MTVMMMVTTPWYVGMLNGFMSKDVLEEARPRSAAPSPAPIVHAESAALPHDVANDVPELGAKRVGWICELPLASWPTSKTHQNDQFEGREAELAAAK